MEEIGLVFGCFIPMHTGHIKLLKAAVAENDKVILGICGYDGDRGEGFLSFKERQDLIKKHYKRYPKIITSVVDDKKIGLTGKFDIESWKIWADELFRNAKVDPFSDNKFTWYTGDQAYIDKIMQVFPKHTFVHVARDGVSGTSIRENTKGNEDKIVYFFKEYLEKNNRI